MEEDHAGEKNARERITFSVWINLSLTQVARIEQL